jgi:hypothetical protein
MDECKPLVYGSKQLHVFDSTSCDADYRCFEQWEECDTSRSFVLPSYGALAGFPCSAPVRRCVLTR